MSIARTQAFFLDIGTSVFANCRNWYTSALRPRKNVLTTHFSPSQGKHWVRSAIPVLPLCFFQVVPVFLPRDFDIQSGKGDEIQLACDRFEMIHQTTTNDLSFFSLFDLSLKKAKPTWLEMTQLIEMLYQWQTSTRTEEGPIFGLFTRDNRKSSVEKEIPFMEQEAQEYNIPTFKISEEMGASTKKGPHARQVVQSSMRVELIQKGSAMSTTLGMIGTITRVFFQRYTNPVIFPSHSQVLTMLFPGSYYLEMLFVE